MSKTPSSAPPGGRPTKTAPPRFPGWVNWLWRIALVVVVVMYVFLPGLNVSTPVRLSYSQFISAVSAHKIKTVNFGNGSSGSNTVANGDLTNGKKYTTVIPGSPTPALTAQLTSGGVKKVTADAPSSGLGTDLLYWLI